jgi:hypothetical protein
MPTNPPDSSPDGEPGPYYGPPGVTRPSAASLLPAAAPSSRRDVGITPPSRPEAHPPLPGAGGPGLHPPTRPPDGPGTLDLRRFRPRLGL